MAGKKSDIAPEDRLTRSHPVFWLARLAGLICAVLAGWVVYGLVVGMDGTTGLGAAVVAAVSAAVYVFLRRKMLFGDQPDEYDDGY